MRMIKRVEGDKRNTFHKVVDQEDKRDVCLVHLAFDHLIEAVCEERTVTALSIVIILRVKCTRMQVILAYAKGCTES